MIFARSPFISGGLVGPFVISGIGGGGGGGGAWTMGVACFGGELCFGTGGGGGSSCMDGSGVGWWECGLLDRE